VICGVIIASISRGRYYRTPVQQHAYVQRVSWVCAWRRRTSWHRWRDCSRRSAAPWTTSRNIINILGLIIALHT